MNSSSIHSINYLVQLKDDRYKHWKKRNRNKGNWTNRFGNKWNLQNLLDPHREKRQVKQTCDGHMRLTSTSSKTCVLELTWPDISIFTSKKKKLFIGKVDRFNLCQLLLTEHVPSNRNLMTLRVVCKRIGLTAQTTPCLRCDDLPRSVAFKFILLLLSLLFVYFSQTSPQRTFEADQFYFFKRS